MESHEERKGRVSIQVDRETYELFQRVHFLLEYKLQRRLSRSDVLNLILRRILEEEGGSREGPEGRKAGAQVGTTPSGVGSTSTHQLVEITPRNTSHHLVEATPTSVEPTKVHHLVEVTPKGVTEVPEATGQARAEPPEGLRAETTEPERPEFPKGEVPLAGVPSSEKPKEPPVDFSWAMRREKLREVVVRWVDVFRKWDTRELVDTFKRCKGDDPTREAVIIVMKERFNAETWPMDEKAKIRDFFRDEEVRKFMEEHGIEGIKEGVTAGEKPGEEPEKKEEEKEGE
jgi:hypothetical protein